MKSKKLHYVETFLNGIVLLFLMTILSITVWSSSMVYFVYIALTDIQMDKLGTVTLAEIKSSLPCLSYYALFCVITALGTCFVIALILEISKRYVNKKHPHEAFLDWFK